MIYDTENFPEIPDSWIPIKVSDAFDGVSNSNKKLKNKDALRKGKYPVIDQGAQDFSGFSNDKSLVVNASKNDPVFLFGDHTRILKYIDSDFVPGADGTKLLKPIYILDSRFAFEMLRAIKLPDKGYARHYQFLRDSIVPLPPLPEQKRIADKLDTLLARVDAIRERLDRIPQILRQFRQSVLAAATSGRLTEGWRASKSESNPFNLEMIRKYHQEFWPHKNAKYKKPDAVEDELWEIPTGWLWVTASEIVRPGDEIVYGIVQPGPKLAKGIPYVRGMDIENGKILVDQLMRTSKEIAERYSKAALEGGDVLLGIIRATKVAVVPDVLNGANITQGTARLRPGKFICTSYLAIALEAPEIQQWLHDHYRGIDMPGLNLADVRKLPLPLPEIAEQNEIVRRVEMLFALADKLEARYQQARAQVEKLTPALLAKAFRGELVEQDPSDEPAEKLLERVRASKAVAPVGKGKKEIVADAKPKKRGRKSKAA